MTVSARPVPSRPTDPTSGTTTRRPGRRRLGLRRFDPSHSGSLPPGADDPQYGHSDRDLGTAEPTVPQPTTRGPERLYTRDFVIAMASQTAFVLASTTLTHYARYVQFLGGTVEDVGWIMGIGPMVGLLMRPWLAQGINRLGPKRMWRFGAAMFLAGLVGNLFASEVGVWLYFLRASLFLGGAIIAASSLTLVTQIAPAHRRTEAIATLGAGGFIAMLAGPLLGDLILSGSERTWGQFQTLFGLGIGLAVVSGGLLSFVSAGNKPARPARTTYLGFIRESVAHWPGPVMLVNLVFGMSMAVPFTFLASYLDEARLDLGGLSTVGTFFAGYAGWGLFVRLMSTTWPERYGRDGVMLVGLVCMGLGLACFPLIAGQSAWWLLLPAVICGTGHALVFPTMTSLTIDRFPAEVRGTGSALCLMTTDLGLVVGSPILGMLAVRVGYATTFALVGGVLLTVATHYFWVQGLRRPTAHPSEQIPPLAPPLPIARALPADGSL